MSVRLLALVVLTLLGASTASAALVTVDVGTLQVFTNSAEIPELLDATLEFEPAELQLGNAQFVDVRIELPLGFDVAAIGLASIRLCRGVPGCADGATPEGTAVLGDVDADDVPDLTVTFDGAIVSALVADVVAPGVETLAVSGRLGEQDRWFAGSAMVTVARAAP